MTSGATGNCDNGEYMTHPAFKSFNKTGFWVGKFETGYKDATSSDSTKYTTINASEIVVKPNVYSWQNITVGNISSISRSYNSTLDSHMMKNTEWGAVAILSHSKYGINREVNINNNSDHKTGYSALPSTNQGTYPGTYGNTSSQTASYQTAIGGLASTTGNITGVYDMSGGAQEYVAAYISGNAGNSGFTPTTDKYFDVYNTSSTVTTYQYRILGDATGEMGPFENFKDGDTNPRWHNNWYSEISAFVESSSPWFYRGGDYERGVIGGQFYFDRHTGKAYNGLGFRIVLTP